jgi:Domain of unknown function (DUF6265)
MSTRVRHAALCALLLTFAATVASAQPAASAATPVKARLQDLAWIAGAWTGTLGDRTIEQHWSAPLGNSIVAMYRSVRNNEAQLYELLAIEQEGEGVALRIKHFSPGAGLAGREAKDESINHTLVSVGDRTAVFQGTGDAPARVSFSSPNPQTLNIVVQRQRDGAPVSTEFKYTRIPR